MSSFDLLDKVPSEELHQAFTKFELNGKAYFGNSNDLESYDFTNSQNILTPLSIPGGVLRSGGQFCDVDISSSSCLHKIDDIVLSCDISNANATNPALVVPFPYILNRVEISFDGRVVETLYSDNLFTQTLMNTSEIIAQRAITEGFSTTTYGPDGVGIVALSQRNYQLPIHCNISKLFMPTTNSVRLRFYFNGGSAIMTSTSVATANDLSLVSLNVYLQGRLFSSDVKNMLVSRYRSASHISRGIIRRYQLINLGPTTSGVQVSQTLSAYTGTFCFLRMVLKATGATQENVCANNWKAFLNNTLIDSSGQAWAFQNIPDQLIRNVWIPSKYNTLTTTTVNMHELDFCVDPMGSFRYLKDSGSLFMDGRYLAKPTPAVTASGGLDLIICSLQECLVVQQPNGTIDIKEQ